MSKVLTKKKIKETRDAAVFARNHWVYLNSAADRGRKGLTCFRAAAKWSSAWRAVDYHGPRSIYFTPIELPGGLESSLITHEAILLDVLLLDELEMQQDKLESNPDVKRYLKHALEDTREEKLWDGSVSTLYLIASCRKLFRPFQYTNLVKIGDDKNLSEDFKYSYSMCYECKADCMECYFH